MRLLLALPWWMLLAWLAVAAWATIQVKWYRHVRIYPPPVARQRSEAPPPPPRRRESSRRRRAAAPAMATVLPTGGSPEFLAELGLEEPEPHQ